MPGAARSAPFPVAIKLRLRPAFPDIRDLALPAVVRIVSSRARRIRGVSFHLNLDQSSP
jgi:hypothetical protein